VERSSERLNARPQASISTPPPRAPRRDLTGKTVGGKYLVRSVLGEGGMGTVFEAEHLSLGRSVAVKVLHPNQARKKNAVRRFHQEARAAGAIGHPNICEVYDLGTLDDGSPYLVMEKLVGETLADRIAAEGGLPFDDAIDILVQVLSGLVAAHEKSIVHRDIKPENVFLTRRVGCPPLVKLLDFGVSKMIAPPLGGKDEDLDLTRTGMVMGTPYYMSPEQARGDRNLDARVDLYACGVIFYEALTGRRPFTAANYNALLLQILSTSPRPARDLRPALPSGFDAVLDKAMARSRDDRYRTAAELQGDLQALRDRHNTAPAHLGDAVRAASHVPPGARGLVAPDAGALQSGPGESARAVPEPTPSSVEIPIVFSGETPQSGESIPLDDAELEEYPMPIEVGAPDDLRGDDANTTQRRGADFGRELAQVQGGVRDTDAMGRPVLHGAIHDTDATGRPAALRISRSAFSDDQDTITKARSGSAIPRRRARRTPMSNPDDTLPDENESGEPTQLMASRAPKAPRT
jgi:serine/threonine protein kinase